MQLNWAIVGTSFISDIMADAIKESKFAMLHSICSRRENSAQAFANKHSIPDFYTNYQQMLRNPEIDVVYIGLPNHLHTSHTLQAIEAGKHVLCEKPMTLNSQESLSITDALTNSNSICMEGLMYRHHPLTTKLKEIVASGELGEIRFINASYSADIAELANTTAGGSIRNLGCYPISLMRLLLQSEPTDIKALGRTNTKTNNDHQASALLRFSNDIIASVTAIDDAPMSWHFEIIGTKASLKMITNPWWPEKEDNRFIITAKDTKEITVNAEQSLFTYQVDAMCHKISGQDCDSYISQEDSHGNTAILEEWLQQAMHEKKLTQSEVNQ